MTAEKQWDIRTAKPRDLDGIAQLAGQLVRHHHSLDPERFFLPEGLERGYREWLASRLRDRRAVVIGAFEPDERGGERAIGYAYGRIEPRDWNELREECGFFHDLAVAPAKRRRGVGRALANEMIARLESLGAPRVVLQVAARNPPAQRLFEVLGFRHTMLEMAREARVGTVAE